MNAREEIKVKITQNKADRQRLCDEADKLDKELAAIDKPKLKPKHADYGLCKKGGKLCGFAYDVHRTAAFFVVSLGDSPYKGFYGEVDEIVSINGNFNDLKLLGEDLEEFRVDTALFSLLCESSRRGAVVNFQCWPDDIKKTFTLNEVIEIHQKLGQLIVTAKRRRK